MTDATIKLDGGRGVPLWRRGHGLPGEVFAFAWRATARHQLGLIGLAIAVFLMATAPLELQRRIVNQVLAKGDGAAGAFESVILLCGAYVAVAVVAGLTKLGFNVYRNWVGETAVRILRAQVYDRATLRHERRPHDASEEGVSLSVVLAEVVALLAFVLFLPQLVFIPAIQRAINRRAEIRIRTLRAVGTQLVDDWPAAALDWHKPAYYAHVGRVFVLNMEIYALKFTLSYFMNLIHHLGVAGVLLVGGWYVLEHRIEVGTIIAFLSGLASINDPWRDLVEYYREMSVARVKYRLIAGVFGDAVDAAPRPAAGSERSAAVSL
ncbi:MAG: ABC transporter ATP-binding protein [Proteobacteria bacterium]|nr:ABC transporter ATP-binding protein [Pseudomonadota bacterium]